MTHEDVVNFLKQAPDGQLLAILEEVFKAKRPQPEEERFSRTRYFLGTADSQLESEEGESERWGKWQLGAVAYIDYEHYGGREEWGYGPDYGFCQFGTCQGCGTRVRSNSKHGVCPVCALEVYMT
jgi:hypothetical protein